LSSDWIFIAHHIFDHYRDQLIEAKPHLEKSLDHQIAMIKADAYVGGTLKSAPPPLQGRIRKRYVRGRKGHRLFYITYPKNKLVIGVFITPEPRAKIDYREFPWHLFLEAHEDFEEKRLDKFRIV